MTHETARSDAEPATAANTPEIIDLDTIRRNRQVVYLRDWLMSQTPWQRRIVRIVRRRLHDAA